MTHAVSRLAVRCACVAALASLPGMQVAAQDIAVTAITQPASGCALTATENVTVWVFNYGPTLTAGSSFGLSYNINSGAPVPETVVLGSNLLRNSALAYTFSTQANLSVPGTYSFSAVANLAGDINPTNNAYTGYAVTNWAGSVGGTLATPPNGSTGTLTLSGYTGNVVQWEESDDNGARWFALANTAASQTYSNLRAPTRFRARLRNGPCPEALSNTVTATP